MSGDAGTHIDSLVLFRDELSEMFERAADNYAQLKSDLDSELDSAICDLVFERDALESRKDKKQTRKIAWVLDRATGGVGFSQDDLDAVNAEIASITAVFDEKANTLKEAFRADLAEVRTELVQRFSKFAVDFERTRNESAIEKFSQFQGHVEGIAVSLSAHLLAQPEGYMRSIQRSMENYNHCHQQIFAEL